jgi:hypothetical protein
MLVERHVGLSFWPIADAAQCGRPSGCRRKNWGARPARTPSPAPMAERACEGKGKGRANVPNVHGREHISGAAPGRKSHERRIPTDARARVCVRMRVRVSVGGGSGCRVERTEGHAAEAGGRYPICLQQSPERPSVREAIAQQSRAYVEESARPGRPASKRPRPRRATGPTSRIHFVTGLQSLWVRPARGPCGRDARARR